MTAQRANGTEEEGEAEEERRALARLLGGAARSERPSEARTSRPAQPPLAPRPLPSPPAPSQPAPRARFELRAARVPGLFGARFLALDHARAEQEVWIERLDGDEAHGHDFEARLAALAGELAGSVAVLPWLGTELDPRGRRLVAQPARDGESLRELLTRRGTLPPEHALEILRQMLRALEPLHARGLAHGSLQAEHVRLAARVPWSAENPFGVEVELAGFGLAGLLGGAPTPLDDVRQAERLLAELLTGLPTLDELSARLPRPVARPLARLGSFASASEFLAALETRRVGRFSDAHPGLRPWIFAATLVLAGSCAWLAWRSERTLAAERDRTLERAEFEESTRSDARARLALERVLQFIEEGESTEAALVLAAARADAPLAARGFALGFLDTALEARRALDVSETGDLLERVESLLVARDALSDARQRRESFLLAGAEWLAAPGPTRAAPREELLRWIEGLERELARRVASLERELLRQSSALTERVSEPRAALLLARFIPTLLPELKESGREAEPIAWMLALAADTDALLGRTGERFLWRMEHPDGSVRWREDRVLARHQGSALHARRWLDGEPAAPTEVRVAWRGTRLVFDPPAEVPLDLATPSRASHFVPRTTEAAPPELPAAAAAAFRARLASASPRECAGGDGRVWLVPEFGLVRRLLSDGSVLELAWRGGP